VSGRHCRAPTQPKSTAIPSQLENRTQEIHVTEPQVRSIGLHAVLPSACPALDELRTFITVTLMGLQRHRV
jgi:hypothetical protein